MSKKVSKAELVGNNGIVGSQRETLRLSEFDLSPVKSKAGKNPYLQKFMFSLKLSKK